MENVNDKSRQRIRVSTPLKDAIELQAYCKRYPAYGITITLIDKDETENVATIEMRFRSNSKELHNQALVHFFIGYANELYFKINQKLIG